MTEVLPGFNPTAIEPHTLLPDPIDPSWVIAGNPQARCVELARSPDGTCSSAQWDCTAGTFHWYFGVEETVHILEGEVVVRDAAGRQFRLRAGDVALMPAHAWMVWQVDKYVRKLAHCRYTVPRPLGRVLRKLQGWRTTFNLRQPKPSGLVPPTAAR